MVDPIQITRESLRELAQYVFNLNAEALNHLDTCKDCEVDACSKARELYHNFMSAKHLLDRTGA